MQMTTSQARHIVNEVLESAKVVRDEGMIEACGRLLLAHSQRVGAWHNTVSNDWERVWNKYHNCLMISEFIMLCADEEFVWSRIAAMRAARIKSGIGLGPKRPLVYHAIRGMYEFVVFESDRDSEDADADFDRTWKRCGFGGYRNAFERYIGIDAVAALMARRTAEKW
jgi:hypothetical protein